MVRAAATDETMDERSAPTQPSLRRMREYEVRPRRDLGQNFLVDSNILGVIERLADLEPGDVVLEIGGGLGVLSEHLAPRCAHVHVVEIDPGLVPALSEALGPLANTTLHVADAMELDLAGLDPAPTKVVANLPYGIAAGAILRTIEELPAVTRWVAMVQKEVGVRLAAHVGDPLYGVPSVIAQLACDVEVARPVSRTVFFPVPNVDSVLVRLERTGPAPHHTVDVPPFAVDPELEAELDSLVAEAGAAAPPEPMLAGDVAAPPPYQGGFTAPAEPAGSVPVLAHVRSPGQDQSSG